MKVVRFFIPFHLVLWSNALSEPRNKRNKADQIETVGRLVQVFLLSLLLSLLTFTAISQSLPDKIRGYKVHRDKISVNAGTDNSDAALKIGDPELVDVSLAGLTFELPAEFTATDQSGKVEFVTFHDVRVNGIRVEPEEYTHRFEFRKSEKVSILKPVRILLPAYGVVRAAWEEMTESRAEWIVTGRAFVFGRFRRFGLYHKRVVPIDLNLVIKNPIRN